MAFNNLVRHDALSRNTLWNIVSQLLPALVALITIPILIDGLGKDRFGLLTICWMISGYFSLWDFGIGRALTQLIASRIQTDESSELIKVIKTALAATLILSLFLALMLFLIKNYLISEVLRIPIELQRETSISIDLLALTLPLMIVSSSLKGILESVQRFDLVNIVRGPVSALSYVLPVLTLAFSHELHVAIMSLLFFRLFTVIFYWIFVAKLFPALKSLKDLFSYLTWSALKPLVQFGSWMTVSNVVGPVMVQMDRLFISNILTISAVGYYTGPYEVVSKLLILPGAVTSVLFPALATIKFSKESQKTGELLDTGVRTISLFVLPAVILIILFAPEGINLWLGADMAAHSVAVTQVLALGLLFVSVAHAPFALLQASGRPDVTAKIHLLELVLYIPTLILMTQYFGLVGTAMAWGLRALVDLILLSVISNKYLKVPASKTLTETFISLIGLSALIYFSHDLNIFVKVILAFMTLATVLFLYIRLSKEQKIFSLKP